MGDHEIKFVNEAQTRSEISDPTPEDTVRNALDTLRFWALGAANRLDRILSNNNSNTGTDLLSIKDRWYSQSGKAFAIFFGWNQADGRETLDQVDKRLKALIAHIDDGVVVKLRPTTGLGASNCRKGWTAFQAGAVGPSNNVINLCPKWFDIDPAEQFSIVGHEILHAAKGHRHA